MTIALSHGGSNTYSSPERAEEVLVGTKQGIVTLKRNRGGSAWEVSRRALEGRHISSIIVEPRSGMIFAGGFFGSVHASADGGLTWERRDAGLSHADVYCLAYVYQGDQIRIFAGTEPAHLFFSDDYGNHWTELASMRSVRSVDKWWFPAPPHTAHVKFITFDPNTSSTIYACIEQGAFLKSADGGKTWIELNEVGSYTDQSRPVEHFYDVHKALIDPRDPRRIYVTGGAGLYVTDNGGAGWERWMCPDWADDVYPDGLVFLPRDPETMFVSAAEHNPRSWRQSRFSGSKIYRTRDGGKRWEVCRNGLPERMQQEVGALCLHEWGESFSVFAATTAGEVFYSDDGGDHWSLAVSGLAPVAKKGHEVLLGAA